MRLAALVLTGLLLVPLVATTAAAQPSDDDPDVALHLTDLTGVLGPGSGIEDIDEAEEIELRVLVENRGERQLGDVRLVTEIHRNVTTQTSLADALDGELVGAPLLVHDAPVGGGTIAAGDLAGVVERFGVQERGWALERGGVHPVRIAAVRGTQVLAEKVTAVVWLDRQVTDPLLTTMVWPIDAAPLPGVGGAYAVGADREIRPGGRIDRLVGALERDPDAEVVLAPAAHLVEDLRDRADGFTVTERQPDGQLEPRTISEDALPARLAGSVLERLREVTSQLPNQPISAAYADADLSALRMEGPPLSDLAAEAAVEGRRRLQLLLGRDVDPSAHLLPGPIDAAALDLLPGDVVLLPSEAVSEPREAIGRLGALRTVRSSSGRLLDGLVADPDVTAALDDTPQGPVAVAQRVIATTALRYLEDPEVTGRATLVMPPLGWEPSPELLDRLLTVLRTTPWLEPSTPRQIASSATRDDEPLELAAPQDPAFSPAFADALAEATDELAAARLALPEGTTTASGRSGGQLHDTLVRASSRWLRGGSTGKARSLVRDVGLEVADAFGTVEIAAGSVTLTSDAGQIPVTLQRTRGGPVSLQVEVASQGRLLWPDGRQSEPLVLEEGEAQTVSFATQALSTGTFPVTVRVTDPSGRHELATTGLSVRSTAISRPALAATGAVVALLLLAGVFRRRRRPRPPTLEVVG